MVFEVGVSRGCVHPETLTRYDSGIGSTGRSDLVGFHFGAGSDRGGVLDSCSTRGAGGGPSWEGDSRGMVNLLATGVPLPGFRNFLAMSSGRGIPVPDI